ncbi:MAG: MBL fold metallo-hydrolase [Puniceicoccaceae bacterium]|nr:MAG: MBL fold metallo-hydrolase [Puniceicoccaceae bacterium]
MESVFHILGSSSAGNCGLLKTEHSKILIDAGFSATKIAAMLASVGESIDSIDGVFLTHEHGDHAAGIRGLAKRCDLPIYANRQTAQAVQSKIKSRANWKLFETGTEFTFRDFSVRSFSVPHDAYDPVGFTFHWGENDLFSRRHSLGWITDLGYVPELVKAHAESVEFLVVEANYDDSLLDEDQKRPWSTKQRIRSRHGHLSNKDCFSFLDGLHRKCGLKRVCLAHLSKDCNAVALVKDLFHPLTKREQGMAFDVIDPACGPVICSSF